MRNAFLLRTFGLKSNNNIGLMLLQHAKRIVIRIEFRVTWCTRHNYNPSILLRDFYSISLEST